MRIRIPVLKSHTTRTAIVHHFIFDHCGWAIFTLCNETGELAVSSDWGSWSYRWHIHALGFPTLVDFLIKRRDDDYVANKLMPVHERLRIDDVEAERQLREAVDALVERGRMTAGDAADSRAAIEEWKSDWFKAEACPPAIERWFYDLASELPHTDSNIFLLLRDTLLPLFRQALAGEPLKVLVPSETSEPTPSVGGP